MKKVLALILAMNVSLAGMAALAEPTAGGTPPQGAPAGQQPGGMPGGSGTGGMPGGTGSQPVSYTAVTEIDGDSALDGETDESTGTDENAILVTAGNVHIGDATITRNSADSSGGDGASFYGVGAAVLTTGGTLYLTDSDITTDASGGTGVFAYGDGVVYVSDTAITTAQDTSGGIHVAGGGTLYAKDLTVETGGGSSAAIRSDRGGGTMVVDGGTYVSNGSGSPAIYVTADITVHNATLTANGSEALCLEGLNTVKLYDCDLSGNMPDQDQNDNTWTVILYQSMSGDAAAGEGRFEMAGGTLASGNGGLFYTTNTESEFVLSGVTITAAEDGAYFLRCTGNANQRGWGASGANGADCAFTGIGQAMNGDILWDSISQLDLYATSGSVLTGAVIDDESCAGNGGEGYCNLYIDSDSTWIVTGNSTLTTLSNLGTIADENGESVTVAGTDGTIYVQGTSPYAITVTQYNASCDLSGAGTPGNWSDYEVSFE